ncbi:helix-turn-helix transcriptional regulator [Fusibacter sp. Q10-2]|uniref:Helix-turn-helix transcriptional regulator n=2 Tax=Fusibacter ferrireducens TaxID=2785058 RepID=A0ABR9ZYM2_9FIRM|nr:helix-turn-helix transcriptional regulator [Fusibacter ferrireducens]
MKYRKEMGWSQEELADKLNISRQSVSKWESGTSTPELNKIILLADIFGVSIDTLVKDDVESYVTIDPENKLKLKKMSIDDVTRYEALRNKKTRIIAKNVMICIYACVPLFFLLAMKQGGKLGISTEVSVSVGLASMFIMVSFAISGFFKADINRKDYDLFEKQNFTLEYGIKEIYQEKSKHYRPIRSRRLSISISMIIISVLLLIISGIYHFSSMNVLLMFDVMILLIGASVAIIIDTVSKYNTYQSILQEGVYSISAKQEMPLYQKYGAVYWPIIVAIYLAWSFWTMDWGTTWIVWPVSAVLFAALMGLVNLLKNKSDI